MNKPTYAAIKAHSPSKPVLIFVSSRRQTRLTALDIIAYAAADERPRAFVHMTEYELDEILLSVRDASLRHTLQFGIGLHHAGEFISNSAIRILWCFHVNDGENL